MSRQTSQSGVSLALSSARSSTASHSVLARSALAARADGTRSRSRGSRAMRHHGVIRMGTPGPDAAPAPSARGQDLDRDAALPGQQALRIGLFAAGARALFLADRFVLPHPRVRRQRVEPLQAGERRGVEQRAQRGREVRVGVDLR